MIIMSEKEMFEKLLNRIREYDATHERVLDTDKVSWFYNEALPVIKMLCDVHTDMNYVEEDNGITVSIETKELLLLPSGGDAGVLVLSKADECKVNAVNNRLHISLYYSKWKDVEVSR